MLLSPHPHPSVIGTPFYLMDYCAGRIFKDPSLPGLEPSQRREIYSAMNGVLCKIHSVDIKAAGLEDYGKHGTWIPRDKRTAAHSSLPMMFCGWHDALDLA